MTIAPHTPMVAVPAPPDDPSFAQSVASAIFRARDAAAAATPPRLFTKSDIVRIIAEMDAARTDKVTPPIKRSRAGGATRAKPKPPTRNALFDALAAVCGYPPQPTRTACRTIGSALAEIREVCPTVTPEEIQHRGALIRRKYDNKTGPFGISAHWHEFGGDKTKQAKANIYVEPQDWSSSAAARSAFHASPASWALMVERGWFDLAPDIRADILKAMSGPSIP